MMNRQDYFIQQLGIGPIWRLSDRATDNVDQASQTHHNLSENIVITKDSNDASDVNRKSVDVLILSVAQPIKHQASSQINSQINSQISQETEMLFERLLQAFQLNSQMSMVVQNIHEGDSRDELEKIIQSSSAKVLAVFGIGIAKKLLDSDLYSIDDTHSPESTTFNHHPLFVFHSPQEILKNTLLKKTTWEKMCALKSNLH